MTVTEFIMAVNNSKEPFYSLDEVYDYAFDKKVATIDFDKHSGYDITTDVYRCEDGFVGVTGLNEIFCDGLYPSDLRINCEASEYEEVQVISYKPKKCHS